MLRDIITARLNLKGDLDMLQTWVKLLPVFVVEYLAKSVCERFTINLGTTGHPDSNRVVVNPFKGVYIEIGED